MKMTQLKKDRKPENLLYKQGLVTYQTFYKNLLYLENAHKEYIEIWYCVKKKEHFYYPKRLSFYLYREEDPQLYDAIRERYRRNTVYW